MVLIPCRVVESFCSPTHTIVPHISWHDLPYRRTVKKYEDFPSMVFFSCSCGNPGFKHGSIIVNNTTAYFTLSLSTAQVYMIKESVGSPKSTSSLCTFQIGLIFFFPANLMSSTYTVQNDPFSRSTNKHSQLETFSHSFSKRIFSDCLSHNSPAQGWPYRFRSKGTTGSSTLDRDFGHLCRGRRIQRSGHSDFGIFSIIWEHLPFLPGC